MRHRVMQTQETGEQINVHETNCEDDAYDWIEDNADNYPESTFCIESFGYDRPYFAMF